jgi:hypothetical protein
MFRFSFFVAGSTTNPTEACGTIDYSNRPDFPQRYSASAKDSHAIRKKSQAETMLSD